MRVHIAKLFLFHTVSIILVLNLVTFMRIVFLRLSILLGLLRLFAPVDMLSHLFLHKMGSANNSQSPVLILANWH